MQTILFTRENGKITLNTDLIKRQSAPHLPTAQRIAQDIIQLNENFPYPQSIYPMTRANSTRSYKKRLGNHPLWEIAASALLLLIRHDPETALHAIISGELYSEAHQNPLKNPRLQTAHYTSVLLHDVGKLALDRAIINKQEKLSEGDWKKIKEHPEIGCLIIICLKEHFERTQQLNPRDARDFDHAALVALTHHARLDGTGYPTYAKAQELPVDVLFAAACDCTQAMHGRKSHRPPLGANDTIAQLMSDLAKNKLPAEQVHSLVRLLISGTASRVCHLNPCASYMRDTYPPAQTQSHSNLQKNPPERYIRQQMEPRTLQS